MCDFCHCRNACFYIKFDYLDMYLDIYQNYRRGYYYDECKECDYDSIHIESKYICRFDCHAIGLFNSQTYKLDNFEIDKNYNVIINYKIVDDCDVCNSFKIREIEVFGVQLQLLPTAEKIVKTFIKTCLSESEDQKILKSIMIRRCKFYYPNPKEKYKTIKSIIDKEIEHDKTHYLGYKFKDENSWPFSVLFLDLDSDSESDEKN